MSKTAEQGVRFITVEEGQEGQRIDNFLLARLKGVPKSLIYRILRSGEVRVNKGRIKPAYRVQPGDTVRIPPVRVSEGGERREPGGQVLERVQTSILHEDDRFIILNKPSGIAVHGGSGLSYGLIEALRALRPEARSLELAHRLDRDTSGCLVVTKKRSALRAFHELLRGDGIDKRYLALVQGQWRGRERRVDAPLRKNALRSGERLVVVAPDGKPALTLFRPVTIYGAATLMEARLITGRTHQVRVHAAHSGHPIAGDEKYGDSAFNREMAGLGLRRLFLHASEIRFSLSEVGEYHIKAPLDGELKSVLGRLEHGAAPGRP